MCHLLSGVFNGFLLCSPIGLYRNESVFLLYLLSGVSIGFLLCNPIGFCRNGRVFSFLGAYCFLGFTQTCLASEASSFARMQLLCCFITSAFTTLMPQAMRSVSAMHLFMYVSVVVQILSFADINRVPAFHLLKSSCRWELM